MEDLRNIFANNLIRLRKSNNLTQSELAEKLNYSDKAISKWERGESIPDAYILKELSNIFNVSIDSLLSEEIKEIQVIAKKRKHIIDKKYLTTLAISPVWLIATIVFCMIAMITKKYIWVIFSLCIPISCIILLIFNSIWGDKRKNYLILSLFTWSVLMCIYLFLFSKNLWQIYIIGIPFQIIIILWSKLKKIVN